jgi:hypothetical protein
MASFVFRFQTHSEYQHFRPLPPVSATIIVLIVQSIPYRLYSATFVRCARWLIFDDDGWNLLHLQMMNWLMILMATLIFIFSTADLGVSVPLMLDVMGYSLPSHLMLNVVNVCALCV